MRTNSKSYSDSEPATFAPRLLRWFDVHGRHDLPWQQDINPYRVWVSEIMLQQTQVSTAIPYYLRFMNRFPDVEALAAASEDEVLHLWTGLGYYARGRNLLKSARLIQNRWGGQLPEDPETLQSLPGIGRSTAAAICAISHGKRTPILDGNVKRVLCRIHAIDSSPYENSTLERLWRIAEALTPAERCAHYTQAIMDLGATLCTRSKPACDRCPMRDICLAYEHGMPTAYPAPRTRKTLPERQCKMLLVRNKRGETLLQKRPSQGLWGGLWSLPQIDDETSPLQLCEQLTGKSADSAVTGSLFRHTFSHYHLDIEPVYLTIDCSAANIAENDNLLWYGPGSPPVGLAAPVKKLLNSPMPSDSSLPTEPL